MCYQTGLAELHAEQQNHSAHTQYSSIDDLGQVCLIDEFIVMIALPPSFNWASKAVFLSLVAVMKEVVWWTKLKGLKAGIFLFCKGKQKGAVLEWIYWKVDEGCENGKSGWYSSKYRSVSEKRGIRKGTYPWCSGISGMVGVAQLFLKVLLYHNYITIIHFLLSFYCCILCIFF